MRPLLLLLLTLLTLLTSVVAAADLTRGNADQYAVYAMMASNSYFKDDRTYFPIEAIGWKRVDSEGNPAPTNSYSSQKIETAYANLQYDIWIHPTQNKTVIAFKGTDEKVDWLLGNLSLGISIPYKVAKQHVERYLLEHPDQQLTLTGHSLGGGMALSISLWLGVDAVVFNTSARLFDGAINHNLPAERKVVFQQGDKLLKLSRLSHKFKKRFPKQDRILSHFEFNGESDHRIDLMAEGMLRCTSSKNPLSKLKALIPHKVECYF